MSSPLRGWSSAIYELADFEAYLPDTYPETISTQTEINMNQKQQLNKVTGRNFIVGSFDADGGFCVAPNPIAHLTATSAEVECERLARISPGKAYVYMQLRGAKLVSGITSY